MKFVYLLLTLAFLTSCNSKIETEKEPQATSAENITIQDMNHELSKIKSLDNRSENTGGTEKLVSLEKMVQLEAQYKNPKTDVSIYISYQLDDDNRIKTIHTTSSYKENAYLDENVQVLVGKTLAEAIDTKISGGSLTIPAFKNALKENL